jgi:hypothetical protein
MEEIRSSFDNAHDGGFDQQKTVSTLTLE